VVFGAPHFLWLLLLAVPLVALYTRRPRRVTVRVPSLRLWTHVDGVARAPARRLLGWLDQRLVALLLFLLALAGVVLGLARPGAAPAAGRVVVAIVDVSADMAVRTGAPARARLERAREALARLDATGDVRRWVIAAGAAPRVIAGPGEALPAGAPALEGGRADLDEALRLAREVLVLAGDDDAREVWLLSAAETPESDVPVRRVDVTGALAPRAHVSLDGTLTRVDAQHVRLRARLENRGRWSSAALVEVLLDGAPLVRERPLPLGAGEALDLPPRDLACPRGGLVEVRLLGSDGAGRLDDALAWVVPAPRRLKVTLDDPRASPFLRAALEADAQVDLVPAGDATCDVLVTTRPGVAPRAPGVVWVGPAALTSARGLEVVSPVVGPASPRLEPGASGLDLAGLDLEDRLVAAAARVTPGPGWRVLARAGDDPGAPPLLLARDDPARREVALAFDLARSDLVVGRALPLLLARAARWVARHDDPQPAWTRAGEVARVPLPAGSRAVAPDGAAVRLVSLAGGGLALPLDRGPGVYRLASGAPLVAARPAPPGRDGGAPAGEALPEPVPAPARRHDLALLGVLLALSALVVEAVWFHRRGLP
jgi:hypothetical protein